MGVSISIKRDTTETTYMSSFLCTVSSFPKATHLVNQDKDTEEKEEPMKIVGQINRMCKNM